jgi:hypothetical protein
MLQFIQESVKDVLLEEDEIGEIWPKLEATFKAKAMTSWSFAALNIYTKMFLQNSRSWKIFQRRHLRRLHSSINQLQGWYQLKG